MRKLNQKEINHFKKMVKDIDKKINEMSYQMFTLAKCKEGLQSFIDTKVAYNLNDIKKKLFGKNARRKTKGKEKKKQGR